MSGFHELIKNFSKTREYVRDFFVYGFKTREEFKEKSPRTYDNERRRLESWLRPYVRRDSVSNGINLSLAIDSNLLDSNPLFRVWKTKSFTDNDIILHFFILDLLMASSPMTAESVTAALLTEYESLFDTQTVRRKCNDYAKEGLLIKEKKGNAVVYSIDHTIASWLKSNDSLPDALSFYQLAECFGVIGNTLLDQLDCQRHIFRVKHSFFVHTLEEEILLSLIQCMNQKYDVRLTLKNSKSGNPRTVLCTPLQIFSSTRSGRRFLCGYIKSYKRFTCFRLDSIKQVAPADVSEECGKLQELLAQNRPFLWGVSFQNDQGHRLDTLTMTIRVHLPAEHYIVERLSREGRDGTVTIINQSVVQYETRAFDCNEMLPWVRTFTGRILSLTCTDKSVEQRFRVDLQTMYHMYQIEIKNQENI